MKSVGESMAIGRTFKEAFQKGLRALEIGRVRVGDGADRLQDDRLPDEIDRGAARRAASADAGAHLPDQARDATPDLDERRLYELTEHRSVVPGADARAARCGAMVRGARASSTPTTSGR